MAGIYIHIPFCKSKCSYCNFFSVASRRNLIPVVQALLKEISMRKEYLDGEIIETIYFGGGTPSSVHPDSIRQMLREISKYYPVDPDAEITLEANPDDLDAEILKQWISDGINRISIGVQSFHPSDLLYLERKHDAGAARRSVDFLSSAELKSWSADLIYAIPGQTSKQLQNNLQILANAGAPHISCYALTVEEKTALFHQIGRGRKKSPEESRFEEHFNLVKNFLQEAGYLHYEISNFALPDHISLHNSHYWTQKNYLGLGPSAHSYDGKSRCWNVSSITGYIHGMESGSSIEGEEILAMEMQFNEFVMTRLRTMWGINRTELDSRFGPVLSSKLVENMAPFLASGHLQEINNIITLTSAGQQIADRITAALFTG
jgi:putative oxygen-independent coproporphyrinogen III oxidase